MFKKVVIPLDGSPLARLILDHIHHFAPPQGTELILVRALEAWRYAYSADGVMSPDIATYLRDAAKEYLEQQRELLEERGYQVTAYVVQGEAAHEILHIADITDADLIAMTTRGRSGIAHWALGSVAERVIHSSPLPVLLVRQETDLVTKIRRILVPLDGSELAEQALPAAMTIAQDSGAELLLWQMVQTPDAGNRRLLFTSEQEADATFDKWLAHAEDYLAQTALRPQADGIVADYQARFGDPAAGICDAVEDEEVDLLVLSTHGRTGLNRWYYGSVANKVIRGVHCPVLLVRNVESAEAQAAARQAIAAQPTATKQIRMPVSI